MKAIRFAWREAIVSLRRGGRSVLLSIGTMTVAFFALGGFLVISSNLQRLLERWTEAAEMSVFLRDDVREATVTSLASELRAHRSVTTVEYVSKDQALARFKADFPELVDLAGTTEGNPFPASLELRLRTDPVSSGAADALATQLVNRAGVADVRYDGQWLSRLFAVLDGVRLVGVGIAAILVLGAAFTVAAVVRLSLYARRDELEIMQLVGAPLAYIRGPSILEGLLLGASGACCALVFLWIGFRTAQVRVGDAFAGLAGPEELRFLTTNDTLLVLGVAVLIGGLAGAMVSRALR